MKQNKLLAVGSLVLLLAGIGVIYPANLATAPVTATVQVVIDIGLDAASYSFGEISKGTHNIPMLQNPHRVIIYSTTTVRVDISARIDNSTMGVGGLANIAAPAGTNRVIDNVGWWQSGVGLGIYENLAKTTNEPIDWMQDQGPPAGSNIDLYWYGACSTDADQYGGNYGGTLTVSAAEG